MQTALRWSSPLSPVVPAKPSSEQLLAALGKRIVAYRKRKGWTQSELGRRIDRRQETLSRWETGTTEPTILECVELARVLGVTLDELVLGRKCP